MPPNVPDSSTQCPGSMPNKIQERIEAHHHQNGNIATLKDFGVGNGELKKKLKNTPEEWFGFQSKLLWSNIIALTLLHIGAVWTILTFPYWQHKFLTAWVLLVAIPAGIGVTGGAHRHWTHRTYKANTPLKIILATFYLLSGMNTIFDWVRDHRVHHKFSETDADPHNTNRGFFFSHVGWLMMKKHPEVIKRGNQVDMSDILEDPVVQFVDSHFTILKMVICFILPTVIPIYFWNQDVWLTLSSQWLIRYPFTLNATWSVNSFAHFYGSREYDKLIRPAQNRWVSFCALGEGWHNYHHAFPWDYKAAELGYRFNLTTKFIDAFAKIGWATDLKTAPDPLIEKVVQNRGDGTHPRLAKAVK
ncbi:acyl-CoA Delta-9 desaturase-like [Venturia canescens]|uniref:acyl-CoA Delta-9 desaturase-like n=1 Tax=Venturia canescens TaxID=32260 RepID=UPI001C9BBFCF|nr:acyl-CoA Delta-9 desaturase-like [Venturia canescens]